jgi:WD40 repeat protein
MYCGVAFVHDLESGRSWDLTTHGSEVCMVDWTPSGDRVVTSGVGGRIQVGSVEGDPPHLIVDPSEAAFIRVHPGGKWIAATGLDGVLRLWPMPEGQPFNALPADELVARLRALTNYRVVRDEETLAGYRLDVGPFPGWEELPTW